MTEQSTRPQHLPLENAAIHIAEAFNSGQITWPGPALRLLPTLIYTGVNGVWSADQELCLGSLVGAADEALAVSPQVLNTLAPALEQAINTLLLQTGSITAPLPERGPLPPEMLLQVFGKQTLPGVVVPSNQPVVDPLKLKAAQAKLKLLAINK